MSPFNFLAQSVAGEYVARGYSRTRADYIGRATAGKVAREKAARRRRHRPRAGTRAATTRARSRR